MTLLMIMTFGVAEAYYDAPPGFQVPPSNGPGSSSTSYHSPEVPPRQARYPQPNAVEEPLYPPGLDIEIDQKRVSTPAHSNVAPADQEETQPIQLNNLEIAQQVFDLLLRYPQGLQLREISQRITLPQKNGQKLHDNARVGVAVTTYKRTFSLSAIGSNGRITIIDGAPRPGGGVSAVLFRFEELMP
ncbi:hypothetical protein COOONC_01749 [Cooperia oncophora]